MKDYHCDTLNIFRYIASKLFAVQGYRKRWTGFETAIT